MNFKRVSEVAKEIFDADCLTKSRKQKYVFCRFAIANFIYRHSLDATYENIGTKMKKNQATIGHYIKKHDHEYNYNFDYQNKYDRFASELIEMQIDKIEWMLINNNIGKKHEAGKIYYHVEGKTAKIYKGDFTPKQLRAIANYIENNKLPK